MLACPRCRGGLVLSADEHAADGHVMRGALACEACALHYPIERGVPRFVPESLAAAVGETVEAFGYQWQQATRVLAEARFSAPEVFLDFVAPVRAEWFRGRTVLDGGCGSGRFTLLSAAFGARLVVGIDLSSSVDIAFERTRHLEVLIVQGDMLHLPVRRAFDYAFSVGVLHHTADPDAAFAGLAATVAPGGGVSAWVYGRENNEWIVRYLDPMRRVTSRLPRPLLLAAAHAVAVPLTLATRLVYGPLARSGRLPWLARRLFYFDYMVFLSQFGFREHAYIVFDHAVPVIADYIARERFVRWFEDAGLTDVTVTPRANNSWRGFGRVPA